MQLDEHFQRRLNEARMFFAEGKALAAEKIYRDLLKPDLPAGGRVLVLDGLGRCLHIQGRLEEAETFFRESLRFLEELFGPNHIHVAGGLQNLARLRSERGECEEAATLGERALDILKQNLPADDLRIADALPPFLVMILMTPPVASSPYTEAPGPLITSILSTFSIFVTWSRLTPVDLLPAALEESMRELAALSTRRPSTKTTTRVSPLIEIPLL